jgi:hypothetical protein
VAQGPPFCTSIEDEDEPGSDGGPAAATGGTSAVAPDSDAAIARKSASFKAAVGGRGMPATAPAGTVGDENTSRGKSGTPADGAEGGTPILLGEADDADAPAGEAAPGNAAKNSLASLAIVAGSGIADINAPIPTDCCEPASGAGDVGESVAMRSLVLWVLIDIDALQYTDCIVR